MPELPCWIYGLTDSRSEDLNIRYVGRTSRNPPELRYSEHLKGSLVYNESNYKAHWIRELFNDYELLPGFVILEECNDSNWVDREIFWVEFLLNYGFNLTNLSMGGESTWLDLWKDPIFSRVVPKKVSESRKKRYKNDPLFKKLIDDHCKRISPKGVEAQALMRLENPNFQLNKNRKVSEAQLKTWGDPEYRAKYLPIVKTRFGRNAVHYRYHEGSYADCALCAEKREEFVPELPEIFTIVQGINSHLIGRKIRSVEILDKGETIIKNVLNQSFCQALEDLTIGRATRHGKWIQINIEPFKLIIHLGMYGSITHNYDHAHQRIRFTLDDGFFTYNDVRNWGRIYLFELYDTVSYIENLGTDPLDIYMSARIIHEVAKNDPQYLANFLLDQSKICGIGNIYRSEILWHAKLSPFMAPAFLTLEQCDRLNIAIAEVLVHAISNHGTSISDYIDVNGDSGTHQNHLAVYGRNGYPCQNCKTLIVRRDIGRAIFYCPTCQPNPA